MAISVQKAIDLISNININTNFEIIPIESSVSRICAKAINATSYLPKFNNSAMDGYAIIYENKKKTYFRLLACCNVFSFLIVPGVGIEPTHLSTRV